MYSNKEGVGFWECNGIRRVSDRLQLRQWTVYAVRVSETAGTEYGNYKQKKRDERKNINEVIV